MSVCTNTSVAPGFDTLTVGQEAVTGRFAFTAGANNAGLTVSNGSASIGGGLVTLSNVGGSATFTTVTSGTTSSTALSFNASGGVSATTAAGATFGGTLAIDVEQGGATPSIAAGGTGTLNVSGAVLSGTLEFADNPAGGPTLTLTNGSGAFGGTLSFNGATAVLAVAPAGVTGSVTGDVDLNPTPTSTLSGTLALAYANGAATVGVTGARLTLPAATLSGDLTATGNLGGQTLTLTATNFDASLAGGLVTVGPDATASLTLAAGGRSFTGSVAGPVASGPVGPAGSTTPNPAQFAGNVSVNFNQSGFLAIGTGDTLTINGTTVTGDIALSANASGGVDVGLANANLSFGSVATLTNAAGHLSFNSSGAAGSAAGTGKISLPGFSGSGGLSLAVSPSSVALVGRADTVTLGKDTLTGNFAFTRDATGVHLAATGLTATLTGGLVTVSNASGSLDVDAGSGVISGSLAGTVAAGTSAFAVGGTVSAAFGPSAITVTGTDDSLSVGTANLSNVNLSFAENTAGLQLAVSGASYNLGGALYVDGASGTLNVAKTGLSGSLSGTASFNSANLALTGSLGIGFAAATATAPATLAVAGTKDTIRYGDQSVSGDFTFSVAGTNALSLTSTDLTASLGPNGLVTVGGANGSAGASGSLQLSNGLFTGGFDGYLTAGTAGSASFAGLVHVSADSSGALSASSGTGTDTLTIGGQSVSGQFAFAEDPTTKSFGLNVSGGTVTAEPVTVTNIGGSLAVAPAGVTGTLAGTVSAKNVTGGFSVGFGNGSITVAGTGDTLTVGGQTISGDFSFVKSASGTTLNTSNTTATLGDGLVTVTGGAASLAVAADGTVSGSFTGTVAAGSAVTDASSFGLAGTVSVAVAPGAITASGTNDTLTVGGFRVAAGFAFTYAANTSKLTLGVSNLNFSLAGAVGVSNASGNLIVSPAGVAGDVAGTVTSSIKGFALTGSLAATFAPGTITVAGTGDALTFGNDSVGGDFTFTQAGGAVSLTVANATGQFGGGSVVVNNGSGTLTVANGQVTGTVAANLSAGSAQGVQFSGPLTLTVAPTGFSAATTAPAAGQPQTLDTLTVAGTPLQAAFAITDSKAAGVQLMVSGLNFSVGNAVSVSAGTGTLSVGSKGVSGSVAGTVATSFADATLSGSLAVSFAPGTFSLTGTNDTLTIGDQAIAGNFTFLQDSTGLHLNASSFTATLGGGLVTVANGTGSFNVVNGKFTGGLSGTVTAGTNEKAAQFSGPIAFSVAADAISAGTRPARRTRCLSSAKR